MSDEENAKTADALVGIAPRLRILGTDATPFPNPSPRPLMRYIRESGARIVIVALECPLQHAWMLQHADDVRPALAVGLANPADLEVPTTSSAAEWLSANISRLVRAPWRLVRRSISRDHKAIPFLLGAIADRFSRGRARVAV